MAWEENSRICINMQLIAILSRTGVTIEYKSGSAKPTVSYNVSKQLKNNFLQGKAYTINLTIGLTPIEFDADVTGWDPITGTPIEIPLN